MVRRPQAAGIDYDLLQDDTRIDLIDLQRVEAGAIKIPIARSHKFAMRSGATVK